MKEEEKTSVSRDDLATIIKALEMMQQSLSFLDNWLAGITPAEPSPDDAPQSTTPCDDDTL